MNYTKLRKTLGQSFVKALASVCLTLAVAAALAPQSYANVDQAQQFYGAIAQSSSRLGGTASTAQASAVSTTTVVMNLWYNGSSSAAYITTAANGTSGSLCVTFYAPYNVVDKSIGVAAAATTCGTTGGTFDLGAAGYTTLGQLCDAINTGGLASGLPQYHCTLRDAVRSDAATSYLPTVTEASGVNNLAAVGGYPVPAGTSSTMAIGIIPAQGRHVILNWCQAYNAGTPVVQVYGIPAKFGAGVDQYGNVLNDSYLSWVSPALAATTATFEPTATTTFPTNSAWLEFANPGGAGGNAFSFRNPPVGNAYNGHVVIRAGIFSNTSETSADYMNCSWTEK